ncbi:glutaminyl-peptide cyclotransferase [Carboxylicivirga sp. N1Y90]|uniref:glutaminyl-peptide cyclotransferase n=1 Tax=Carboxylicivirga fragile TaxID=3417571 RepID=UPI003D35339D|nr:glutaminyl-peptide cyclotransferase [Marinilabiliaceae bacterium N1Y90]
MKELKYICLLVLVVIFCACGIQIKNHTADTNGVLVFEYGDSIAFKLKKDKVIIDSVYEASTKRYITVDAQSYYYNLSGLQGGLNQIDLVFYLSNGKTKRIERSFQIISDIAPEILKISEYTLIDHDTSLFTQGLVYDSGYLFESAGLYGHSTINKINASNGKIIQQSSLDSMYFAEGLCLFDNELNMLTWKEGKLFRFTKELGFISGHRYRHEGWGLTNTDSVLICSDGTSNLRFISPRDLKLIKQVTVIDKVGEVRYINEMEFINNQIWANKLGQPDILIIDIDTGRVLRILDFSDLIEEHALDSFGSFNGIAFNKKANLLYVTGKNWPYYIVCDIPNF